MLYAVSGPSSPFSRFGYEVVQAIARSAHGEITAAQIGVLEKFRDTYVQRPHDPFVTFIHPLDMRVAHLFERTGTKIIVFQEDLSHVAATLSLRHGYVLRKAISQATASLSSVASFSEIAAGIQYPSPSPDALFLPFIQSLADFYGLEADEALVAKTCQFLGFHEVSRTTKIIDCMKEFSDEQEEVEAICREMDEVDSIMLSTLTNSYSQLLNADSLVEWPSRTLFEPTSREQPYVGPIAMAGPARRLLTGPAYHLTPGNWVARVIVAVEENLSGNMLSIRVAEGKNIRSRIATELPPKGRLEITIGFEVHAANAPVSFLFGMEEGAIEGLFDLESITLRRSEEAAYV